MGTGVAESVYIVDCEKKIICENIKILDLAKEFIEDIKENIDILKKQIDDYTYMPFEKYTLHPEKKKIKLIEKLNDDKTTFLENQKMKKKKSFFSFKNK